MLIIYTCQKSAIKDKSLTQCDLKEISNDASENN